MLDEDVVTTLKCFNAAVPGSDESLFFFRELVRLRGEGVYVPRLVAQLTPEHGHGIPEGMSDLWDRAITGQVCACGRTRALWPGRADRHFAPLDGDEALVRVAPGDVVFFRAIGSPPGSAYLKLTNAWEDGRSRMIIDRNPFVVGALATPQMVMYLGKNCRRHSVRATDPDARTLVVPNPPEADGVVVLLRGVGIEVFQPDDPAIIRCRSRFRRRERGREEAA